MWWFILGVDFSLFSSQSTKHIPAGKNYSLQKRLLCHSQNDVVLHEWYFDGRCWFWCKKWLHLEPRCNWKRRTKRGCYPPSSISIILWMIDTQPHPIINIVSYSCYLIDLRLLFLPYLMYIMQYISIILKYLYVIFLMNFFRQLFYN